MRFLLQIGAKLGFDSQFRFGWTLDTERNMMWGVGHEARRHKLYPRANPEAGLPVPDESLSNAWIRIQRSRQVAEKLCPFRVETLLLLQVAAAPSDYRRIAMQDGGDSNLTCLLRPQPHTPQLLVD